MANSILRVLNSETSKRLFAVMLSAVLTVCSAAAQERQNAPRIVTWNCSGCHGIEGNAQLRYFPRIAGLNAQYAERRIAEFRGSNIPAVDELFSWIVARRDVGTGASRLEARTSMVGIACAMTAEDIKTTSAWYAKQKPALGHSADSVLIQRGKEIYLKGLPAEGLIACQTCHGAQAEGKGATPALAGQNSTYVMSELAKFNAGDRRHAPEMTMVAQHGEDEQFRALAAYLQSR